MVNGNQLTIVKGGGATFEKTTQKASLCRKCLQIYQNLPSHYLTGAIWIYPKGRRLYTFQISLVTSHYISLSVVVSESKIIKIETRCIHQTHTLSFKAMSLFPDELPRHVQTDLHCGLRHLAHLPHNGYRGVYGLQVGTF